MAKKIEIDPAAEIYEVAQQEMKAEIVKMQDQIEVAREESFAMGILKKIEYDNAHNEFLEHAVLHNIKQAKEYKDRGMTWKQFCEALGKSVRSVDAILNDITPLVEKFSASFADLSGIKFSKIRYLGRSISAESAEIGQTGIVIDGETIPISPEYKEDIEAYIDDLKSAEKKAQEEKTEQVKAKERVIKSLHKTIATQEKDLSSFKKKDPEGITGAEKEQLKGLADLKIQFDLFARGMDITVNGYLKDASGTVRAEYGSTIAYGMKVLEHLRDRAYENLDISIFPAGDVAGDWEQPEWTPPEELIAEESGE